MKRSGLAIVLTLLIIPTLGLARTWHVTPGGTGEAPTIQAGIDSAAAADTVLLSDNVFTGDGNRDIDFKGKAITVRSESGDPALCIIDCEGTSADHHWGFKFNSGEVSTSVLEGITITHAYASDGAGVTCAHSSPTIRFCNFVGDTASSSGGAMSILASSAEIIGCEFVDNYAGSYGGAIEGSGASATLNDCTFIGNRAAFNGGGIICFGGSVTLEGAFFAENSGLWGGGMAWSDGCDATLIGVVTHRNRSQFGGGGMHSHLSSASLDYCTFVADSCGFGGAGIHLNTGASLTVDKTIIAFGLSGAGIYCESPSDDPVIICSCVYGNETGDWVGCIADEDGVNGNICEDPLFCDLPSDNFTVEDCSPCLSVCGTGIGSFESGCACGAATAPTTWGRVKAEFAE